MCRQSAKRKKNNRDPSIGHIRSAQDSGQTVVMVGDGINDAPVLAGADASVAPVHGALLAQTNAGNGIDRARRGETISAHEPAQHTTWPFDDRNAADWLVVTRIPSANVDELH